MDKPKPFVISKKLVYEAYKLVKANKGGVGVDRVSMDEFEKNLKANVYKIWNRLSSGSYFPPAVKGVEIPKKQGGKRMLGVPTISDRIAQTTIKLMLEPILEPIFLKDSYGYRPGKSALDAIGVTRERCWQYDWVLEFDIKGLFDNIDHELLMKAVEKHTKDKCILLYIKRWIKASLELADGTIIDRISGTPQGGVISPLLSNLFLHYVFDKWMDKNHSDVLWCRYADDGMCHLRTKSQAESLWMELNKRFKECKLEMHQEKTKIVYCKDGRRKYNYQGSTSLVFLGYEFRARRAYSSKKKSAFSGFLPAICKKAIIGIQEKVKSFKIPKRVDSSIGSIAESINPAIQGWINYYGRYTRSAMNATLRRINSTLVAWSRNKYLKLRNRRVYAIKCMNDYASKNMHLFAHWNIGVTNAFT